MQQQMLRAVNFGLDPVILSPNLACYTGRRGIPGPEEVLGLGIVFLRLDGISELKSVALVFLAAISWEIVPLNIRNHTVHATLRA